jgi:diguanylate cyclase (GGDEF)-like protein
VHGTLAAALALVTCAVWYCNGQPAAIAALGLYACVPLAAATFLPGAQATAHLAATWALCIAAVALSIHSTPVGYAVSTCATAGVAAAVAGYLRAAMLRWATTDPLTLLPNRQALRPLLERQVACAQRWQIPLAVAVVDMDHFKTVNDTRGHNAGDQLLRDVASRWRAALRRGDELVRYGGDEFVAVLPGCDAAGGTSLLQDLRRSGGQASSVGVAQWLPGEPVGLTLARADQALYQAKRAGRDRVVVAGPVPVPPGSTRLSRAPDRRGAGPPGRARAPGTVRARRAGRPGPLTYRPLADHRPGTVTLVQTLGLLCMAEGLMFLPTVLYNPAQGSRPVENLFGPMTQLAIGGAMTALARRRVSWLGTWLVHGILVAVVAGSCLGPIFAACGAGGLSGVIVLAWIYMYLFAMFRLRTAVAYSVAGSAMTMLYVGSTLRPDPVGVFVLTMCAVLGPGAVCGHLRRLLERQSLTDPVTGLPNRGYLDTALAREVRSASRNAGTLSVAIIDLDHFKEVNDAEGHQAGDDLLAELATTWARHLRVGSDLVRYGGDEFILLLPGHTAEEATAVLERLRASARHPSSVGLTEWGPDDTTDSFIARADAALYRAKDSGRDRVVVAPAPRGRRVDAVAMPG